jgi:hypothetical protein
VVKQVDAAELRVVAVAVLAFAADAVLVARHFLKLRAHLLTALTRLHVHDFAQIRSLEVGSTREKKDGEERRNLLISAWQFVYPERENEVVLPLRPLELRAPCEVRRLWADAVAIYIFRRVLIAVCQGRQSCDAAAAGEDQLGRLTAGQSKYYRLYLNSGK